MPPILKDVGREEDRAGEADSLPRNRLLGRHEGRIFRLRQQENMAEREGFEPSKEQNPLAV